MLELHAFNRVCVGLLSFLVTACGPGDSDVVRRGGPEGSEDLPESQGALATPTEDGRPVVMFLGTSLTAGYGLEGPADAYPALIQERIDGAGLSFRVVNAGVSGDTSAGGVRRLDWLLDHDVAVLVVELGANDGLRGLDIEDLEANLQAVVDLTRARHPHAVVVVAGMEAPPNLGSRYTTAFREVFGALASANDAPLIPFLLDGVAGIPELNQADRIHPTAEGHRTVADNVWKVLGPILGAWVEGPTEPDTAE